jgi:uncharacterized protein (DUF362 family)
VSDDPSAAHRGASAPVSRRAFLKAVSAGAVVAAGCRRAPYVASDFVIPRTSPVALLAAPDYERDLTDVIVRGLQAVGAPSAAGRRVLLKPNIVEHERGTAINTHPAVIGAAAQAFLRAGAREVVVAEGAGHRRDTEYLLQATGLLDVLTALRIPFVDLNLDDVRDVRLKSWFTGLQSMHLPVQLLRSDLVVSLPKLKTHHWAGMTCAMKNLFGTVPGAVYGWPKNILHWHGIDNSIVDLTATVRPSLAIVDAVVGMEGDGPIMGKPRTTGFIAIGQDAVAVDATCARAIGIEPRRLGYLDEAARFLGNLDERRIEHRGERPDRFRFQFDLIESKRDLRSSGG